MTRNGPRNHRELSLFSAGMYAGYRNTYMARAARATGAHRSQLVRFARENHHTYLARLREANGAAGYRAPVEVVERGVVELPSYGASFLRARQAS